MQMILRLLLCVVLLIRTTFTQFGACTVLNDCNNYGTLVCDNSVCSVCTSDTDCRSQHTVRVNCVTFEENGYCVQCQQNSDCSAGQTCITSILVSLCASTCTSPTSSCGSGSQCIYMTSLSQFYCLTCENDIDCKNWSGNSASQCIGGVCSPAFLSCFETYDCTQIASYLDCIGGIGGGTESSTCIQCKGNAQCATPTPYCSANNLCVQCTSDTYCADPTPYCTGSGTCGQCTSDSNCTAPTPHCNLGSNTCVQCTSDSNCTAPTPYCTESNTCGQSTSDSNCTAPTPHCSGSNTCVRCKSDSDCTAPTPYCSGSNTCVKCTADSQCSSTIAAQCLDNGCIACTRSDQCAHLAATPQCNLISGACVAVNPTTQVNSTTQVDPTTQSIATALSNFASSAIVAIGGIAAISASEGGGGRTTSQGFITLRITKIGILIRYINIDFPYQTEKMFEAFSSSQSFIKKLLVDIFGDQQYNQTTIDLPTRFVKFGDSSLFLKNTGNTLLLCLLVVILIVINRILLYWARKKKNRTWIERLLSFQKTLEWNYILGYILATYPDLIVGFGLQLYNLPFSNPTLLSISSFVIFAFIAPFAILFPLICNMLMRAENENSRRSEYHNITRYKSLISDFKENNSETKTYQMIGLLRIQAMVFPLIFWQSNPLAQILFMIVSSVMVNIFQITKVPFNSKFTSFVILTNELLLLISMIAVFLHIVLNSSGVETSNPKVTTILGWIITVVLLCLISFNLLINVIELLQLIWRRLKSIIFRSKVPEQQRSSSRLSNRPLQIVPPSSLGNSSLDLSHSNNAMVDNNMSIRIRPRNMRPIEERF